MKINLDIPLLKQQKEILVNLMHKLAKESTNEKEANALAGIINLCDIIQDNPESFNRIFPNGFDSWQETHFEVVMGIADTLVPDLANAIEENSVAYKRQEEQGTGGLYELAEELTNEFETINQGKEWDGEFRDELDKFLDLKLK